MAEKKVLTDVEKEQKLKKMDEVFESTSDLVLTDIVKIVGRDLTDEEKKTLCNSLKTHFVMTCMLMHVAC